MPITRRIRLLACLAALAGVGAVGAQAAVAADPGAVEDLRLESSPLLRQYLNDRRPSAPAPSGAFGLNARWERGEVRAWRVAYQRNGENAVVHGILTNNGQMVNLGLRQFNWAFARQNAEGGFPGASSSLYQYASFAGAVARACMLLEASQFAAAYRDRIEGYRALVRRTAAFMASPAVYDRGSRVNRRFTHRRYIVALGFALSARFTGDQRFRDIADRNIRAALRRQRRDGVNPENGGYDTSYQAIGIALASRWMVYERGNPHMPRVRGMIARGLRWQLGRVTPAGNVRRRGDTRTSGQEVGALDGRIKGVSFTSIVRSFLYWGQRGNTRRYLDPGVRVAERHLASRRR